MTSSETYKNYAQMPLDARKELALIDPEAAKSMALEGLITLATEEGYCSLEEQAQQALATVRGKQLAIGASLAADPDDMENSEAQYLKAEMPAYAAAYFEHLREFRNAVIYSEELPSRLSFGSKFAATIQYPDREQPSTRNYLLLGPGETKRWKDRYTDPNGMQYTVISYLSPLGRALWGADATGQAPPTFQPPNASEPAIVLEITLLGKIS